MEHQSQLQKKSQQKWTWYHLSTFMITFFSYALFHATRKAFSNVKNTISENWRPSSNATCQYYPHDTWYKNTFYTDKKLAEDFMGVLDAVFLLSYAVGLYISGIIGDRVDMRFLLSFGMCSSAVTVFFFGTFSEFLHIYNVYYYVIIWILSGLLQSTGWPTVVSVMANWFGKGSRGLVLGLWSSCASVGNIIGAVLVGQLLMYGYHWAMFSTAACLFCGGIIVLFSLIPSPTHVGLEEPSEADESTAHTAVNPDEQEPLLGGIWPSPVADYGVTTRTGSVNVPTSTAQQDFDIVPNPETEAPPEQQVIQPKAISFFRAFLLPGVIFYSLAYACLKFVNYAFFFWLPFYLSNALKWPDSVADEMSTWYDVGGIIGGTIGGYISDRLGKRGSVCNVMLLLSIPSLWVYSVSPANKAWNSFLMANVGFWIGGPSNLISAAIAADLGRQEGLRGDARALSTVTGIVDGTGSLGAAVGQVLVPIVQTHLNWHWVFYLFMLMMFLTVVCISPVMLKELKSLCTCCRGHYGNSQLTESGHDARQSPSSPIIINA